MEVCVTRVNFSKFANVFSTELSVKIGGTHTWVLPIIEHQFEVIDTGESSNYGHPFGSTAVQVAIDALPEGKWRHFAVRVG